MGERKERSQFGLCSERGCCWKHMSGCLRENEGVVFDTTWVSYLLSWVRRKVLDVIFLNTYLTTDSIQRSKATNWSLFGGPCIPVNARCPSDALTSTRKAYTEASQPQPPLHASQRGLRAVRGWEAERQGALRETANGSRVLRKCGWIARNEEENHLFSPLL